MTMSLDQVGLIALFILIPLLESVLRSRRARTRRPRNGTRGEHLDQGPPAGRVSPLPTREIDDHTKEPAYIPPLPSAPSPLPLSLPHQARGRLMPRNGLRASRAKSDVPASLVPARRFQKRSSAPAVSRPLGPTIDLRRAIVLTTILGPCRALESGDAPHRSS